MGLQVVTVSGMLGHRGDTRRLGRALGRLVRAGDLIVLDGALGAGKTFLVRALARGLEVPTAVRVSSPTFSIVHELTGRLPLVHMDLYRIAEDAELEELGLRERIGGEAVVVVEWGGRFAHALGVERLDIRLAYVADGTRAVRLEAHGVGGRALLRRLQDEGLPGLSTCAPSAC